MDVREYWKNYICNEDRRNRRDNRHISSFASSRFRNNHNNTFEEQHASNHDEIINQLRLLNENIMSLMSNKNPCVISKQYKNQKKVCKKCGKEKDISEFNMLRQKRVNKNGEIVIYEYKQSRCKACTNDTSTVRE